VTSRLHSAAVAASRTSAASAGDPQPAVSPPGGMCYAGGALPLAFSAQQLAIALGYRDAASVYDLARRDQTFPKPVQFTSGSERRYLASDVVRWLESK